MLFSITNTVLLRLWQKYSFFFLKIELHFVNLEELARGDQSSGVGSLLLPTSGFWGLDSVGRHVTKDLYSLNPFSSLSESICQWCFCGGRDQVQGLAHAMQLLYVPLALLLLIPFYCFEVMVLIYVILLQTTEQLGLQISYMALRSAEVWCQ